MSAARPTTSWVAVTIAAALAVACSKDEKAPSQAAASASAEAAPSVSAAPSPSSSAAVQAKPKKPKPQVVTSGLVDPGSIALTPNAVLVAVRGKPKSADDAAGSIISVPKSGGEITRIAERQSFPHSIVTDGESAFWATLDAVVKAPVGGGRASTIYKMRGKGGVTVIALDSDRVYVDWMRGLEEGGITALAKKGGARKDLFEGGPVPHIAPGGDYVALCSIVAGRVSKTDPSDQVVMKKFKFGACDCIAADSTNAYWCKDGQIWKAPIRSGTPVSSMARVSADVITVHGRHLFWAKGAGNGEWDIGRIPTGGGEPETLVGSLPLISALAVDDTHIYWLEGEKGKLMRAPLEGASAPEPTGPPATAQVASSGSAPEGMVAVPAGMFTMGSDDAKKNAKPARKVTISKPFFIDRTEVTVGQFEMCVTAGKCTAPSIHGPDVDEDEVTKFGPMCNYQYPDRKTHPVNCVDHGQAIAYCAFVGKRLPTEAEWEYAARGTDGRMYPWGNEAPGCEHAVVSGCRKRTKQAGTMPVGSFADAKSPFGAVDMAGNVWEWVSDDYNPKAYKQLGDADPSYAGSGALGVLRGGSWDFAASHLKSYFRLKFKRANGHVSTGFRCAK